MSVGGPKEHDSLPVFDYNIIEYLNILLSVRKRVSKSGFKGLQAQKIIQRPDAYKTKKKEEKVERRGED